MQVLLILLIEGIDFRIEIFSLAKMFLAGILDGITFLVNTEGPVVMLIWICTALYTVKGLVSTKRYFIACIDCFESTMTGTLI